MVDGWKIGKIERLVGGQDEGSREGWEEGRIEGGENGRKGSCHRDHETLLSFMYMNQEVN